MLNKGQKVAIVIALIGILMIVMGFTIGLIDKINENRCMNMPTSEVFSDKSCSRYITDYINRWTDEWWKSDYDKYTRWTKKIKMYIDENYEVDSEIKKAYIHEYSLIIKIKKYDIKINVSNKNPKSYIPDNFGLYLEKEVSEWKVILILWKRIENYVYQII